ncbi:MAG TPA: CarD family transcriptional regulator [Lachnospiraceae bacterium]|nr:CarD family transcriptional regulator [Lachnospiraceae bacterium]
MFQKDDMVVYGSQSVCRIVNIGTLSMSMIDRKKKYYTLKPIYQRDSVVYVPVDSEKPVMRPVITKEQAQKLIKNIPNIKAAWIEKEVEREQEYKKAISSCDPEQLIMIIKTLYSRKKARIEDGKKVTVIDERYFKMAEKQLHEELAYALEIPKEEIADYISGYMNKKPARQKQPKI